MIWFQELCAIAKSSIDIINILLTKRKHNIVQFSLDTALWNTNNDEPINTYIMTKLLSKAC